MSLETGSFISDLNASNPTSTDLKSQGDDHIRLLKATVKGTFPNVSGAVTVTHTELNTVTAKANSASPTFTGIPTAPTATTGTSTTQLATTAFATSSVNAFTGAMLMWPTATAPTGFLLCNGAVVSRSTYAALFAILGVVFGSGDGSTTFTLPDYRDRMPVGAGTTYAAAGVGGSKDAIVVSHTHTATSTVTDPGHIHTALSNGQKTSEVGGPYEAQSAVGNNGRADPDVSTVSAVTGITVATTNASAGSSGTNANLPPYLGVYFIIKT